MFLAAKDANVKLAESLGVKVLYNTEISMILKAISGKFDRVQIVDVATGNKKVINADELFIAIGFKSIGHSFEKKWIYATERWVSQSR